MSEMPSRDEFEQYKSLRDKGDYRAAAKVLMPYKDNPKVQSLILQLKAAHSSGAKPKPTGMKLSTWLWVVLLIVGIILGGITGYLLGSQGSDSGSVQPPADLRDLFESACMNASGLSRSDCRPVFEFAWEYYKSDTVACLDNYSTITSWTDADLAQCVVDVTK
jgi:hypothetical protein